MKNRCLHILSAAYVQVHFRLDFIMKENSVNHGSSLNWVHIACLGAQWLSGRVLDSRPKGRRFEPHRLHCVVVLEQDTFILA